MILQSPVHITIRINGAPVDGILLTLNTERIRVVVPGCSDTIELRPSNEMWTSEDGVIEIDAMLLDGGTRTDFAHTSESLDRYSDRIQTWASQ